MSQLFTKEDWNRVLGDWEGWWTREREQPLLNIRFWDSDPGMQRPEGVISDNIYDYINETPAKIAEKMEYLMRTMKYEFAAFPSTHLCYGPIPEAEYIGCRPIIRPETVWYEPKEKIPVAQRKIKPDKDSIYLPHRRNLAKALQERFGSDYALSVLGYSKGNGVAYPLDILATFYTPEEVMYMMYDEPDEVHRLLEEIVAALDEISKENDAMNLTPGAVGYEYGALLAPEPWFGCQCDFSAMIGPDMFEEFVAPYLEEVCRRSPKYNFYHLDGPGELIHVDRILEIPNLRCIQWVPGPQKRDDKELAIDLCYRMHKANVNSWLLGPPLEWLRDVADKNGTTKGLHYIGYFPMSDYDKVMKIVEDLMSGH